MAEHARASTTINAKPAAVMAAIADISAYSTWSGPVERAEVVVPGPDGRPRRARFLVNAVVAKEEFVTEYTWCGDDSVSWTLVEGKNLVAQNGSYVLRDLGDGRTEVTYDLTVELKVKIPSLIRRKVQSGVVDAALRDLKKHLES
ncbi:MULTISPECIES: SRPBCC family protein [unclassified Frankia]|uniref:SRPBCC family protein n=1 Tax=unclassified Frankia TaxID=2632575 RepID=UPI002024977E